jgi:hypothetical protein
MTPEEKRGTMKSAVLLLATKDWGKIVNIMLPLGQWNLQYISWPRRKLTYLWSVQWSRWMNYWVPVFQTVLCVNWFLLNSIQQQHNMQSRSHRQGLQLHVKDSMNFLGHPASFRTLLIHRIWWSICITIWSVLRIQSTVQEGADTAQKFKHGRTVR